jgi:hypothetical protein
MEQQTDHQQARLDPDRATIARALRLLESQRQAARAYYARNRDAIKARTARYWDVHRDQLNARRTASGMRNKRHSSTRPQNNLTTQYTAMDFVRRAFRDTRSTALTLGVGTVVATHVAMIVDWMPGEWSDSMKKNHAGVNLAAAGAILYGARVF